jgi:hypothetical protein
MWLFKFIKKLPKKELQDSFIQVFKNIRWHRFGKCNVCGNYTIFLCQHGPDTARDYMHCPFCISSSRKRHVASVVIKHVPPPLNIRLV